MSTEATLPAPPPIDDKYLPEGMKVARHDATEHFEKHEAAKNASDPGRQAPPAPPKKEIPAPAVEPKPEVKVEAPKVAPKVSLADQMTKPVVKAEVTPAPVAAKETAVEADDADVRALEAKMIAANPKWKPSEGWTELKTARASAAKERDEARARADALEKKIREQPVAGGLTAEQIADLQKREKDFSDKLMVAKLEAHPKFNEEFVVPKNAAVDKAKQLLAGHGLAVDVDALVALPQDKLGKALAEAMKDVPIFDQVEVATAIRTARAIDENGRKALSNSREIYAGIVKKGAESAKASFEKVWMPIAKEIGSNIVLLQAPEGATPEQVKEVEDYNAAMRQIQPDAERIMLGSLDDEGVARAASKAAAYDFHVKHVQPRLLREFSELKTSHDALFAELTALRSRNPNLKMTPSSDSGSDGQGAKDPTKMGHDEAADHYFNKKSS